MSPINKRAIKRKRYAMPDQSGGSLKKGKECFSKLEEIRRNVLQGVSAFDLCGRACSVPTLSCGVFICNVHKSTVVGFS